MKHKEYRIKRVLKRITASFIALIMFFSNILFPDFVESVCPELKGITEFFKNSLVASAAISTDINVPIDSVKDLYLFSKNYLSNSAYQRANLQIDGNVLYDIISTRDFEGDDETYIWTPIGTSEKPFGGRIEINIATPNTVMNFGVDVTLFDYIMDSVEIVNVNGSNQLFGLVKSNDVSEGSTKRLFANHVVHDSQNTPSTWRIQLSGTGSNSGLFGTIGTGTDVTEVNLELGVKSSAAITASENTGLICGSILKDSKVNVTFVDPGAGSVNSVTNITSSGGCCGGYVGEMGESTELNIYGTGTNYLLSDSNRNIYADTYAGGLVGKNDRGTVTIKDLPTSGTEIVYDALGTISSNTAAGGVFGYYKIPSGANKFSTEYYKSTTGCTLASGTVGALVGELDGNGSDITYSGASSNSKVDVKSALSAKGTNYGGIIGIYTNTALINKLEIEHINVEMNTNGADYYGGTLACLGGTSALFVYIDDVKIDSKSGASACTYFGGAIGNAGSNGSLLDIGSIEVVVGNGTYKGGGVVGKLDEGVLRLSGTTNLSKATCANAADTTDDSGYKRNGQIVGERKNALVYALGDGSTSGATYDNGWSLTRSSSSVEADDVATWGEVVRISDAEIKDPATGADTSSYIFVYDSNAHEVTVGSAVTAMASQSDLVRTALNMQLNDGDKGALKFDSGSGRTNLLKNTGLTISGNISFSGTGVTGFMRDGYLDNDNEISSFTGKLSKASGASSASITLAVGERYGVGISSNSGDGKGEIHGHKYNGLFARTGDGAVIENVDLDGTINVIARVNNLNIGAVAALAKNALTLTSVNATETINYNRSAGSVHCIGGLIGTIDCDAGKTVTIQGTSSTKAAVAPDITIKGTCIDNKKDDDKTVVYQAVGGAIGYISSVTAGTTVVQYINLAPTIDASGATVASNMSFAGLIADIKWNATDTRTLQLNDIELNNTEISTPSDASNSTGGMLGYRWFGTNVEFLGTVELKSGNVLTTNAAHIAGLVYRATGHWSVPANGIKITDLAFKKDASNTAEPESLGMIVHDGYYSASGMFLELKANDSYTLASGLSNIPDMTDTGEVYDELVACLSDSASSLLENETSGVISYKTDGVYNMSGSSASRNSYKNIYNPFVVNNRSRYYYNADSVSYEEYAAGSTNDYKLLFWSLNKYAAANIASHFTDPFSSGTISGSFDLNNISYYPIDVGSTDSVTLNNVNIIFYNDEIEQTENTGSDTKRSTRDTLPVTENNVITSYSGKSQHYLMHMGLFKDVSGTVTTSGTVTLSGTVGVNEVYCGALINGNLTGSLITSSSGTVNIGYDKPGANENDPHTYTPLAIKSNTGINITDKYLLINSIGNRAVLDLNNLKIITDAYTGGTSYASSLIGDVQGIGINLKFNKIKIDASTSGKIFEHATLLNKYDVDSTSVAVYNFSHADDWGGAPDHYVTYGKELSTSVEYANQENRYYESDATNGNYNGNYVSPSSDPGTFDTLTFEPSNSAADFSTGYLPYVYVKTGTATYTLHEIKVNVIPSDLTDGCGTYDHPYVISTLKQLESISKMLDNSTTNNDNIGSINLPPKSNKDSHWCVNDSNAHRCLTFTHSGGNYTNDDTTDKWNKDEVKAYLASAYYQISGEITISSTSPFTGLGAYDSAYAFKGVIVGQNAQSKIINNSGVPFIKISNGCVVRQLKIDIDNGTGDDIKTVVAGTNISTSTVFSYDDSDKNMIYGGVIGKIMGGDNIIDNVSVTYSNLPLKVGTTSDYLYTVGGYVGVIVNGALIFRNMTTSSFNKSTFAVKAGTGTTNCASTTDFKHLFINPYVGRVINGYAINETTKYSGDSAAAKDENDHNIYKYYNASGADITETVIEQTEGTIVNVVESSGVYSFFNEAEEDITVYVTTQTSQNAIAKVVQQFKYDNTVSNSSTLDNSTKNYQIADVKSSIAESEKLYYDTVTVDSSAKNRVNIPTGQSLFILSLITQSGAGTAETANGDYKYAVGYHGINKYNAYSAASNTATHLAQYDKVGLSHDTGITTLYKNDSTSDYYLSKSDKNNNQQAIPYIIHHYTKADSGNYPARMMTGNTEFMKLTTQNGIYNLPDGFRGIGSIAVAKTGRATSMSTDNTDNEYQMHIYGFDGNGATISEQLVFNCYINDSDNYANKIYGKDNINIGMGLFNILIQKSDDKTTYNLNEGYYVGDFTLTGKVDIKEYSSSGVKQGGAFNRGSTQSYQRNRYAGGGIAGGILPNGYTNLYNLDLDNLSIIGTSFLGGYIGRNNITELDTASGIGQNNIFVNACDAKAVTISGSNGCSGGIIGGSMSGYPRIYVNTAALKSGDTLPSGKDGYYKSTMELSIENTGNGSQCGIGAVAGSIRNGFQVELWINNLTVKGYTTDGFKNESTTAQSTWTQGVGGLFGFVRKADSVIITNCDINNLNIKGPYAGGLFGNIDFFDSAKTYGTSPVIKIANCTIKGDNSTTYSIEGIKGAGGITGQFTSSKAYDKTVIGYKGDTYSYDVDGCEVSGYTISQTGSDNVDCGAGGLFGYARATSATDDSWTKMRTIVNASVHDCVIKTDGSKEKHGMGAVIGCVPQKGTTSNSATGNDKIAIDDTGTTRDTSGICGDVGAYNISCYNITFEFNGADNKAKYGNFVGQTNGQKFKIVGFYRSNNKKGSTIVNADCGVDPSNDSYIINSDYMGVSTTTDHGEAMSQITNTGVTNVGEGAAKKYFPYVTVSPKIYAQDQDDTNPNILTGDGVHIVEEESIVNGESVVSKYPVAKLITNERNSSDPAGDNRIKYSNFTKGTSSSDYELVKAMIDNGEDTSQDYDVKITTYFSEMGRPSGYEGDDFPIIAINGARKTSDIQYQYAYNDVINAYIHVLTNSTGETYQADVAGKYVVDIYPCQCIGGVYQRVSGSAGLKRDKEPQRFKMDDANADSVASNNQISMIDIRYLDPTDASKTAYHLYVPVLTKKMLKFSFSSTALQGTEYESSVYTTKYINNEWGTVTKLASGFDTWQTFYFQYDYEKADVDSFLKTGKGLLWYAPKTVYFKYNSIKSMANDTQFVLLDNNTNKDKEYYALKSNLSTADDPATTNKYDIVSFSSFTTARENAAGVSPARPFTPQLINDIADTKVRYSLYDSTNSDSTGAYVLCSNQETHTDAVVYAYDAAGANKKWFRAYDEDNDASLSDSDRYDITISGTITETYYLSMYTFGDSNVNTPSSQTDNTYGIIVESPVTITSSVITCQRAKAKNTNLFLGDFIEQSLLIKNYNTEKAISASNHRIFADLESTVRFHGDSKAYFHKSLAGETIYQGYYLYLNRYDSDGHVMNDCSIKGTPRLTYSTKVGTNAESASLSSDIEEGAPYVYIPPVDIVIPSYVSGTDWSSTQVAKISLEFGSNENTWFQEFPVRVNSTSDSSGIHLEAASKLEYVEERVPYSNNIENDNPTVPLSVKYYIDRTAKKDVLTLTAIDQSVNDAYDMFGFQSQNRSALGINGLYMDTGSLFSTMGNLEHIDAGLNYDMTNLPDNVFDGTHSLTFKFELMQKVNMNTDKGYQYIPVNIEDLVSQPDTGYLDNFEFYGKNTNTPLVLTPVTGTDENDNPYLYYTYTFTMGTDSDEWPISFTSSPGHKELNANVKFDVKTNDALESIPGYLYSNYRLKVTAEVSGITNQPSDWIVYTNAKINAQYVTPK